MLVTAVAAVVLVAAVLVAAGERRPYRWQVVWLLLAQGGLLGWLSRSGGDQALALQVLLLLGWAALLALSVGQLLLTRGPRRSVDSSVGGFPDGWGCRG